MRKPEVFKMACLRDIQRLFGLQATGRFYAGFGNRITDALSYRSVNVPSSHIFTIDSTGEVKMELLELAGYKSSYVVHLHATLFSPIHAFLTALWYYLIPLQIYSHDGPRGPDVPPSASQRRFRVHGLQLLASADAR